MQNSGKQTQCKGCEKSKPQEEFYLVDGGLGIEGIENLRFEICKECVKSYNTKNGVGKNFCYLLWQHIACYYGAKEFIAKNSDKNSCDRKLLKNITSKINNGYKSYSYNNSTSLERAIQNFIYLLDKSQKVQYKNTSPKRQKRVFDILQNAQTDLRDTIEKILQEDYQTFRQFKQAQGARQ